MSNISASDYIDFLKSKIGTPYVYGAKGHYGTFTQTRLNALASAYPSMFTSSYLSKISTKGCVGKICTDCSGLVCWPWPSSMEYGSASLYSKAYTRLAISKLSDFAPGTVLYKSGHVGIYAGDNICIEAKGIDYGTISGTITNPSRWKCGLTFSWMNYDITNPISGDDVSYKGTNPYTQPTTTVTKSSSTESIKWVQWELVEAGFDDTFTYSGKSYKAVSIDGSFGPITLAAIKAFQASCKITVDGIVGPTTIKYFISNTEDINTSTTITNPYTVPTVTLKYGSTGTQVKWLQYHLNKVCGYTAVSVDGDFGATTKKYVALYQKKYSLTVDGVVGAKTLAAMLSQY